MNTLYVCRTCRTALRPHIKYNGTLKRSYFLPSFAPKPIPNIEHIRQNPGLYRQNCIDRNYPAAADNSWRILELHDQLSRRDQERFDLHRRRAALGEQIKHQKAMGGSADALLEEAQALKQKALQRSEKWKKEVREEIMRLALELPNLSSQMTPVGQEAVCLAFINGEAPPAVVASGGSSHVEIGNRLNILDFEASITTSGSGFYFLKGKGALLEQALVQYALEVAIEKGWEVQTPPSLVSQHIANACGFLPRDYSGNRQVYSLSNDEAGTVDLERTALVLAGTAEIPFAGSQAKKILNASDLPLKIVGPSRSYRAEAGGYGVGTKGLYRVHEFTKVEMFAWTAPSNLFGSEGRFGIDSDEPDQTDIVFEEMLSIQRRILTDLGLHAKVLEMPTTDLGASASRKVDIEAFFPSRGYGEVTSASICTDYQSRRLHTQLKREGKDDTLEFPYTLNGTALAVPRILACILENGWDEETRTVKIPECLRKWMPGKSDIIGPAPAHTKSIEEVMEALSFEQQKELGEEDGAVLDRAGICRYCREPGHMAHHCPKRAGLESGLCFRCGEPGHKQFECPN